MNDLKEVYNNFLDDFSNITLSRKLSNSKNVTSLATLISVCQKIKKKNHSIPESRIKKYVEVINEIYSNIEKKKNLQIKDSKSFEYFLKIVKVKTELNSVFNFYDMENFDVDFASLGEYLRENDVANFKEFYNYFTLLYIESCNFLYPSLKETANENENVPDVVRRNYESIMDSFDNEFVVSSNSIGENIKQLINLVSSSILTNNPTLAEKINKVTSNSEFNTIIVDILLCSFSTPELETMNNELKQLKKEDFNYYLDLFNKKVGSINIFDIITNFDIAKIMSLAQDFMPKGVDVSSDMMKDLFQKISQ